MRSIYKFIILISFTLLVVLAIIEGDAFIERRTIVWDSQKPVSWKDFTGYANYLSGYGAAISSSFEYEISNTCPDSIKVETIMYTHHSWVDPSSKEWAHLLRHEQYHFNISELIARKFRKALSNTARKNLTEKYIENLYYEYLYELNELQDQYDEETDHNLITEKQKDWEYMIDSMLCSYAYYVNPNIYTAKEKAENHKYYMKIGLGPNYEIVGRMPIDAKLAPKTKCYKFYYKQNKINKIEYLVRNQPAFGEYYQVSSIKFNYDDNKEHRSFYDTEGKMIKNENGVYAMQIESAPKELKITHLDASDRKMENKYGTCIKVLKLDEQDRRIEASLYNLDGQRITDKEGYYSIRYKYDKDNNIEELANYNENNQLQNLNDGIACHRYVHDHKKNVVLYQSLDQDLKPVPYSGRVASGHFQYDIYGNTIRTSFLTADGKTYIDDNGIAVSYFEYDAYANNTKIMHYGTNMNLVRTEGNAGRVERIFDTNGRVLESRNFDAYGDYLNDKDSVCMYIYKRSKDDKTIEEKRYTLDTLNKVSYFQTVKYVYNSSDFLISEHYYNDSLRPIANKDGIAAIKYEYDKRGNMTEVRYYNENNALYPVQNGVAIFKYTYDHKNHKTQAAYYGTNQKLVNALHGVAIDRYQYDDRGHMIQRHYYNADETPVKNADGVEIVNYKTDARANVTEERFLNSKGQLTLNNDGIAFIKYLYDDDNNCTEVQYFDQHSMLTEKLSSGIAVEKYEYNPLGNITSIAFFDKQMQLTHNPQGYAIVWIRYDNYNRAIGKSFYSKERKPIMSTDGYASIEWQYDKNSNIIAVIYRDEQKLLKEDQDGKAIYNWIHNRNGEVVKEQSFSAHKNNLFQIDKGPFSHNRKSSFFMPTQSHSTKVATNKIDTKTLTTYHDNGQKSTEGIYIKGKLEGVFTTWYENGQKESEIEYENGKRNGKTLEYAENGQKITEIEYENNSIVYGSEIRWYNNGNIRSRYVDGEKVEWDIYGNIIEA